MRNESEDTHDSTPGNDRSLSQDLEASLVNNWILWVWAVAGFAGLYGVSRMPSEAVQGIFYEVLFGIIAITALAFALKPVLDRQGILG